MTFSTYPCQSRTPQGRGGWTRRQRSSQNSKPAAITRSTRWRVFATTQFTPGSQKRATYQASTTQYPGKATPRTKVPGNLHQQCSTSGNQLAPSIRTTPINQQQPLRQQIWPRQWPSAPPRPMLTASGSAVDPLAACGRRQSISLLLTNPPQNLRSVFSSFFLFSVDQGFRVFHQSRRVGFPPQFPLGQEVFYCLPQKSN